jgi:TatD DNase family protein
MILVDTHCHLDFPDYDHDRDVVINRARECGVEYIINIGSSVEGSKRSVELAHKYECIYAVVGCHPHEADRIGKDDFNIIRKLSGEKKVVAVGETGLDYFKNYAQRDNQLSLFTVLIGVAKKVNLPLVIHTRDAQEDTLRVLREFMPVKAVVHCFSGDKNFLSTCLDLGFMISFTCNLTYKKATSLREAAKETPLKNLLLETDAPYLSPEGFRGKRNDPSQIKLLAEFVADLKGIALEEVAGQTTQNARDFFNLK